MRENNFPIVSVNVIVNRSNNSDVCNEEMCCFFVGGGTSAGGGVSFFVGNG
jgi:hypothetical protein